MSMKAERISYAFTEITAETTYTSFPVLLYNKVLFEYGKTRYIRMRGVGKAYFYKRDKEKAATATVTDNVTVTNPNNDRDYDDSTSASVSVPASTTNYLIRTYDFGVSKDRYLYLKHSTPASNITSKILGSEDGTTWTVISSVTAGTLTSVYKARFRYLRWMADNNTTSALTVYLYTIEAFDLDDYADSNDTLLVIKGYGNIGWVILDGSRIALYAYDLSEVKTTHTYYELVI
jgi:hypothetical protein